MTMQQQEPEREETGMRWKHAFMLIVGFLLILPWTVLVVLALPTLRTWAPVFGVELGFLAIIVPLIVLGLGGYHWYSHIENKSFQAHVVKANAHNAYGVLYERRRGGTVVVQAENGELPAPAYHTNAPHQVYHNDVGQMTKYLEAARAPLALQLPQGQQGTPDAPSFRSIASLIRKDRLIICYGSDGPFFGTVDDLLSSNIVGKPGRGKTLMLYYLIAQFMMIGAEVIAFDPHGSMMEISEYINYEHDYERMSQAVPRVLAVLEERLNAFKAKKPFDIPLLFIIDELPAIAAWEAEQKKAGRKVGKDFYSILSLTKKIILESRKTRFYAVLSGQTISAKVLETDARDNLSSHFVFESTGRHARMGGLESEEVEDLLPHLRGAGPGKCVVSLSRESAAFLGAIPETTRNDLVEVAEEYGVQKSLLLPERTETTRFSEDLMADLNNVTPLSTKQSKYRDDVTYEDAVVAWNAGHRSKRALAKHLNVSEWAAQGWCKKITEQLREIQEDEDDGEAEESV